MSMDPCVITFFLHQGLSKDKSQLQANVAALEKEKRDICRSKDILQTKVIFILIIPSTFILAFKVDTFDIKKVNALQNQLESTQLQLEEKQRVI